MALEDGLERIQKVRRNIEALRDRVDWLTSKLVVRQTEGRSLATPEELELRALVWAIPVLEAEWDNLARMRRNVERIEKRHGNLERNGLVDDPSRCSYKTPEWETA